MTNNVSEYFEGFTELSSELKSYISTTLEFFDKCGILDLLVRAGKKGKLTNNELSGGCSAKQEGNYSVFDYDEFQREVAFFKRFGALMAIPGETKPLIEVRINLVVAHELAHQLDTILQPEWMNRIQSLYESKRQGCLHIGTKTQAEQIAPRALADRHFVSGFARESMREYWAECFACFANKESRDILKTVDPSVQELIGDLVRSPEKALAQPWADTSRELRAAGKVTAETIESLLK